MVYRAISKDIRERVLWLVEHGYAPGDICEIFGISLRSLQRWHRNQDLYGNALPPHLPLLGRPRILNADMTHDLYTLLEEAPEMYLDEIQDWLAVAHDVKLSKTALFENIRDAGITYKLLRKAAAERDEDARAEWMDEVNTHFVAQQLVFVDETSKDDRTVYRHYGRAPAGHRATIHANFVRGDRYSMVAALSLQGYEAVRIVPGSVDGHEFLDFIVQDLLPKMNRYPQDRSIIVLDNCAIHWVNAIREIVEAQGALMIFLPPYSPDFNPIEESFSLVKAWIRRHWRRLQQHANPEVQLLEAAHSVNGDVVPGWFVHSGYNM